MASLSSVQLIWLAGAGAILLLVLLALLFRKSLRHYRHDRRIRQAVERLGSQVYRDLLVPDGMDGVVAADYVVLTHKGILAVLLNHYEGKIFGGQDTDHWTQVVGASSHRFANPLHDLRLVTATLRSHIPNVPISGIVLFVGDCAFPKDKPEGIRLLNDLPKTPRSQQIPPRFEVAWELFLIKARQLEAE